MPLNGALNRTIAIGIKFDSTSFTRDVKLASDSLKTLERTADSVQGAMGKIKGPGATPGLGAEAPGAAAAATAPEGAMSGATAVAGRVGSAITAVGPMMSAALTQGLAPLTQIGAMVQGQMGLIGSVVQSTAAKMQNAMRLQTLLPGLDALASKIRAAVTAASGAAAAGTSMTRLQQLTLALGPAAASAVAGYKTFLQVKTFLGALLSPLNTAKMGLQKISGMSLAAPAGGAAKMTTQFKAMTPAVNRVTASVKGMGLQIGMALGIVGGIYKATQALTGFFSTGIKGAIDLGETMNKVQETFGASGGVVTGLADNLAKKFGLVKGPILDAAASFGLIAQGAKYSKDESAKLAAQMTQLAADTSSFYNIPMDSALEKIRAGLTGESEPLKSLGVLMNEAAVKSRALTLGLAKGKGELSENAKVQARASIIAQGLATASGDLARTQGAVANQFRKSGGGVGNFATSIGTMLMPIVETAVVAFNELLATMITVFEENKPLIQSWVDTVKTGFDTASMVLRNAGDYWTIFKLQTIENLSNVIAYIETVPANLGVMAQYIQGNWKDMIFTGVDAVLTIFINLGKNLREFGTQIWKFISDPMGGFTFNFTPLLEGFKSTVQQLPELIKPPLISMQDEIAAAGQRIGDREKERAESIAKIAPAGPKRAAIKDKPKPTDYKGTAAAELGSKEAGSSIARFFNQGGGNEAKQTADNTKELVKIAKTTVQAIRENKNRAEAQSMGLGAFPI